VNNGECVRMAEASDDGEGEGGGSGKGDRDARKGLRVSTNF